MAILSELRIGLRGLQRNPGFAVISILTLVVGIGVNIALFTLVNGVLLRPLPLPEPGQLMQVQETFPDGRVGAVSPANFTDWRRDNRSFDQLALIGGWGPTLRGMGEPRRLAGGRVTANFLSVLRLLPALGRDLTPADDRPGASG